MKVPTLMEIKNKLHMAAYIFFDRIGLLPLAKRVKHTLRWAMSTEYRENYIQTYIDSVFTAKIKMSLSEMQDFMDKGTDVNNILIVGHIAAFDKGSCNYFNQLADAMLDYRFLLLSEATLVSPVITGHMIHFPFFIVPEVFGKDQYLSIPILSLPLVIKKAISEKAYLREAVQNLRERHKDKDVRYPEMLVYYAYIYFNKVLDIIKPQAVILWNQFFALHHVFHHICMERNVPKLLFEFGSIPGTFTVDIQGQMGESDVAQDYKNFLGLGVSEDELRNAGEILKYLKNSRLNRNIQRDSDEKNDLLKKLKKDRPVIFYAGQNDFESGLSPYTFHTKRYHSPVFQSSDEAAFYLCGLAKINDWNFIYKPHPNILPFQINDNKYPKDMILVKDIDINEVIDLSDICVTIFSQTGYVSLIREKPLLTLGYTQLRGKGCAYEAFQKKDIESQIKKALREGFTSAQSDMLRLHVAQMLKYKLYDDLVCRELSFGRSVSQCADFIRQELSGVIK